jgi:hypothetical protein
MSGPPRQKRKVFEAERLDTWRPLGAWITSGDGEDDEPDCKLVLYLRWWSVRIRIPAIIKPEQKTVTPGWDAATIARLGRDYYIQYTERQYGFMFSGDGYVSVYLGRQTQDSSTEQRWGYSLPWTQWRFIRRSLYGLRGEHLWTELEKDARKVRAKGLSTFMEYQNAKARTPAVKFEFFDFDGEYIQATTRIEEREWHFGTGWWKWLSWFRRPRIRRSLDIDFSKETGERKGSWKGGTLGHGIDMRPGELHDLAFRRYCSEHRMRFIGAVLS